MANNIRTINKKKREDTEPENIPSGRFQPEEMKIEKRERSMMTTETSRSIAQINFLLVYIYFLIF